MQQRYYDPIAGRFLSVDPVTTDAATGQLFNRYNYANNNPYKYTDPDGRFPWGAVIGGGVELGAQLLQGKWSGDIGVSGVVNNLKDVGIAAAAGAITGGASAFAAKQAISGAITPLAAVGKSAAAGAATGAGSAVASDGLQIGGGIDGNTAAKAVIGALTGGGGAAAGGVVGTQAATALNKMAGQGGVGNHIATQTAGAVRGTTTGASIGSSAGSAIATQGAGVAATAVQKSMEDKLPK
jgi:hypothetical protein